MKSCRPPLTSKCVIIKACILFMCLPMSVDFKIVSVHHLHTLGGSSPAAIKNAGQNTV